MTTGFHTDLLRTGGDEKPTGSGSSAQRTRANVRRRRRASSSGKGKAFAAAQPTNHSKKVADEDSISAAVDARRAARYLPGGDVTRPSRQAAAALRAKAARAILLAHPDGMTVQELRAAGGFGQAELFYLRARGFARVVGIGRGATHWFASVPKAPGE